MNTSLYRRIWRWHFFAGVVCVPFILSLAITGALYLFNQQIDDLVYGPTLLRQSSGADLPPSGLIADAVAAQPGQPAAITLPSDRRHNAQVDVVRPGGTLQVFVDPGTGRVAGAIEEDARIMTIVKHIHSLAIAGTAGKVVIEIVAGWIIVLIATGAYLWWPRGRRAGVVAIRPRAQGRTWWRDLHAVTGAFGGIVILFLALTGMPWSVVWGTNVNAWLTAHGLGVPVGMWVGVPKSSLPASALGTLPWAQQQAPIPASMDAHAMHHGMQMPMPPQAAGVGVDAIVAAAGVAQGYRLALPRDAHGVYSVIEMPGPVESQRVRHFDQYSGRLMLDIGGGDIGAVGRVTEWGVAVHQGLQYGWPNLLVMLAGCLALVCLCVSGVIVWWKRRPAGTLAAPARKDGDRLARGVAGIAIVLGCVFPLLGASMLVVLLLDALVSRLRAGGAPPPPCSPAPAAPRSTGVSSGRNPD
jgi:uncharacterized iron-regulated membrane protein